MNRILVTGAYGQFGAELTGELRSIHGSGNVIASDITDPGKLADEGPCEKIDVMDRRRLGEIVGSRGITEIYHLAAILSAKSEKSIEKAWRVNMDGLINVLEIARSGGVAKVFWPSSVAVFGPDAPKKMTPQNSPLNPATVYGISKVAGEQWCSYYHRVFGLDVRSLRYPGLIGYKELPGGGTTDYAVDIFHKALKHESFTCFLEESCRLPMMYMKDAVKAASELMKAKPGSISVRTSYNIASVSFSPGELTKAIRKKVPGFEISYEPDYRQKIADTWPESIDDSVARSDWGWDSNYDLERMTDEIIEHLPEYWNMERPEDRIR